MPKLTIASLERSAINSVFRRYADPGAYGEESLLQEFRELVYRDLAIPEDLVEETGTDGLT